MLLAVVAAITMAGLVWLWPTERVLPEGSVLTTEGIVPVRGQITAIEPCPAAPDAPPTGPDAGVQHACLVAQVELDRRAGELVDVELVGVTAWSGLQPGDGVHVAEVGATEGVPGGWSLITVDRIPVLAIFTILFVVAVLVVAGRKGFFGLLGLVVSGVVLFGFMIPALTSGQPAVWVAIVGSTAIMFVVLYLAHGVSWRTTSAFVGTWLSLLVTTGLGALGVSMARLSGISSEETLALTNLLGDLDFPDILTCSLVIAGLGVLNDVTITQASSVWEVRAAGPGSAGDRRRVRAGGGSGFVPRSLPVARRHRAWRKRLRHGSGLGGTTTPGSGRPSARQSRVRRAAPAPSRAPVGSSPTRVHGTHR